MCLAIYQPAKNQISESNLYEGFRNNPDGAGFMYFDENGALQLFKSMHYEEFIDAYEKAWALHGQYSPFSIHFRWATHGTKDISNVHPFRLNEHVGVLHNGIIDCIITDKKMSDTAAFVRDYLGSLPENWYDSEFLVDMVEDFTRGSKLVIMTNQPGAEYCAYIINEKLGHWDNKVWYSNNSYSCSRSSVVAGKLVPWKRAQDSAAVFEDEHLAADLGISTCELCAEESVLDDVCYTCESCQRCLMTEAECMCYGQPSLHGMTDSAFNLSWGDE